MLSDHIHFILEIMKFRLVSVSGIRRSFPLLGQVNVTRVSHLSPKAKRFYHQVKKLTAEMSENRKRIVKYQERLEHAERFAKNTNFQNLLKHVNKPTFDFFMCQIKNQKLNAKARRYTLDQKILALSLYKCSGKGYKLLQKIFSLPSVRTLNLLLQRIPMEPGINKHIFMSLQTQVQKMKNPLEKTCIVLFDEMELESSLKYNRKKDTLIGFQDDGVTKQPLFADHANVFMVKGVYRKWKQPVVYSFSNGPIKSTSLKNLILEVIKECFSIGLNVVATICDQGSTNQAAIKMLLKDTSEFYARKNEENPYFGFQVDNKEVVPLFDVPHLFKGIRNNLLTKDLHFVLNGTQRVAKWKHVEDLFTLDSSEPNMRLCPKLTDGHVYASKIKKMKVKNCTQVFSHTVGSIMKRIAKWGNISLP